MTIRGYPNETLAQQIANTAVVVHRALQKPDELAALIQLCIDENVRTVLEIGCDAGGTLWAWSKLPNIESVVGVTLNGGPYSTGAILQSHGADIVLGDSHDLHTQYKAAMFGAPYDMVFIDGDHTYEGARQDVVMYTPLVRPEGLIVLQDIRHHDGMPDVGVDRVWAELTTLCPNPIEYISRDDAAWGGIGVVRRKELFPL